MSTNIKKKRNVKEIYVCAYIKQDLVIFYNMQYI